MSPYGQAKMGGEEGGGRGALPPSQVPALSPPPAAVRLLMAAAKSAPSRPPPPAPPPRPQPPQAEGSFAFPDAPAPARGEQLSPWHALEAFLLYLQWLQINMEATLQQMLQLLGTTMVAPRVMQDQQTRDVQLQLERELQEQKTLHREAQEWLYDLRVKLLDRQLEYLTPHAAFLQDQEQFEEEEQQTLRQHLMRQARQQQEERGGLAAAAAASGSRRRGRSRRFSRTRTTRRRSDPLRAWRED